MEKKNKILIVDDDQTMREMYAEILRQEGFDVAEAVDGVDGMDKATNDLPDVIFTGIMMPRMDGFGLVEVLGKNVITRNIPIVMNSHLGREEDRKRAFDMGVHDFLIKGMFTPKDIVLKMKAILGIHKNDYMIRISVDELDAKRLINDLGAPGEFLCPKCGEKMVLNLKSPDVSRGQFFVSVICPKCQR